jgi:hypothetical protein
MATFSTKDHKVPIQSDDYRVCSLFVTSAIESIIKEAIDRRDNKIIINTNLKFGLPMENINKVAGPFVEAWAAQTFYAVLEDESNKYQLINVEALERLNLADIMLQFKIERKLESGATAEVDVKATAEDIKSSGKSPNITSYARIRTAYVEDPDYIFIILSLKHRVYSSRDNDTGLIHGIMEIVAYNVYDLKYISSKRKLRNSSGGNGGADTVQGSNELRNRGVDRLGLAEDVPPAQRGQDRAPV